MQYAENEWQYWTDEIAEMDLEGYTDDDWIYNYGNEEIQYWSDYKGDLLGFEDDLYGAYFDLLSEWEEQEEER